MKHSKLLNHLLYAGLFFATVMVASSTVPAPDRINRNYMYLKAMKNPIRDGLSTRLFFPSSPKEQFIKQLK